MSNQTLAIVIPCFNEARRLDAGYFKAIQRALNCHLIFINDGSTDLTLEVIDDFDRSISRTTISFNENRGKAEAVKAGIAYAIEHKYEFVGICDADKAISEFDVSNAFIEIKQGSNVCMVSSARVPLSGLGVRRKNSRKWIGRMLATLISILCSLEVYDPMSPLKVYRTDCLGYISSYKPMTRWFGEVELMLYLRSINKKNFHIREILMHSWTDRDGGSVRIRMAFRICTELFRLRKVVKNSSE